MTQNKRSLRAIVVLLAVLSSGYFLYQTLAARDPVVATVGDASISRSDVERRDAVIKVYAPEQKESVGLLQLKKAHLYRSILSRHGQAVTDDILRAEAKRIESSTLFPEKLAAIKNVFAGDELQYLRVYVMPVYVERVIYYDFFLKNESVQAEARKPVEEFLAATSKDPTNFEVLARGKELRVRNFKVSLNGGLEWEALTPSADPVGESSKRNHPQGSGAVIPKAVQDKLAGSVPSEEGKRWIEELLRPLVPGAIIPKVIDMGESWLVVKYLGKDPSQKNTYLCQAVGFRKRDFSQWVEDEKKSISVK